MQTFEADISHFNPSNQFAGDEKNPVQFYIYPEQNFAKTEAEGRPIFQDTEYIRIFNSKDNIIERPVRDTDKRRWPGQYNAWKAGGESTPGAAGTRLEHWPLMTRAQVEEFRYFKIFTIEQLAEHPDSLNGTIPGIIRLKQLAKAHVETAKGEVPLLRLQAQIDAKDGVIAEMQAELKRLTKLVEKR